MSHPERFPWAEVANLEAFRQSAWTERLVHGMPVSGTPEECQRQQDVIAGLLRDHLGPSRDRLRELEKNLNTVFVEKEELIRMVFVAAIAFQPLLLVGPSGTAKSLVLLKFCEGLGIKRVGTPGAHQTVYRYLLHGLTEPEEVLGLVNIERMRQAVPEFERLRQGSISDADVVFLDEVFRANSAILNALLSIINERQVYEAGKIHQAKARLIFGASNTIPSPRVLEDLGALFERFVLRVESSFVSREIAHDIVPQARRDLLARGWSHQVGEIRAAYLPDREDRKPVACLNDILLLNRAAAELWGGPDLSAHTEFLDAYHHLTLLLVNQAAPLCEIDDRKLVRLLLAMRAHSLYAHEQVQAPSRADLAVLKHTWSDVVHRPDLAEKVQSFIDR